jgi:Domain of unknown function (DUF932)
MSQNLIVHAGTVRVPEETVRSVPDVNRTVTWNPVPHRQIIDAYGEVLYKNNVEVREKEYSLSRDGKNMFAVWHLNKGDGEHGQAIGIRNSMSKQFSFATCAGDNCFVCDNLAFSSSGQVVYRRHTGRLSVMELKVILESKLGIMQNYMDKFVSWHAELKDFSLTENQIEHIAIQMFQQQVLPVTKFNDYVEMVLGPDAKYAPNLYGIHGAATENLKGTSLFNVLNRTEKLNAFLENEVKEELFRG